MAQNTSTIVRSRLLSNGAAEFLETRAHETLDLELGRSGDSQYEPMRDRFLTKSLLTRENQNLQSHVKLRDLESTLSAFARTLKEKNCEGKLGIALKEPKCYEIEDVMSITDAIQERYRGAENVRNTMGVIRKFFRKTGEHNGQLRRLLAFVPNDSYGAVISGGFTLIIGAAERADSLRTTIYETLSTIPLKLNEVQELSEVHYRSEELQVRADAVFVAIFAVLQRIVNELTKSMAKKSVSLVIKGDRHGFDVTEAIQIMENSLEQFRVQAHICSEQRFGRMDFKMTRSMLAAESCEQSANLMVSGLAGLSQQVVSLNEQIESFKKRHNKAHLANKRIAAGDCSASQYQLIGCSQEEEEALRYSKLQTDVLHYMYILLTASPAFDSKTGKIDLDRALPQRTERKSAAVRRNHKAVSEWFRLLKPVYDKVEDDLRDAFDGVGTMSVGDIDKIQFALTSDAMSQWLKQPHSAILSLECNVFPVTNPNPITYITAYLAKSLRGKDYPTLVFFCGLRANTSMSKQQSGPVALMKSLLSQLLREMEKKRSTTNIPQSKRIVKDGDGLEDVHVLFNCLHRCTSLISRPDCIFILIDSAVYLTGSDSENSEALQLLWRLTQDSMLIVKVVITGVFSLATLAGVAHETFYIPDNIPGGGVGVDPSLLEEAVVESFGNFDLTEDEENDVGSSDNNDRPVSTVRHKRRIC